MTMLVSGVLMSWDTLVISSVFRRSERIRRFTASFIPAPMALSDSAWVFMSKNSFRVSSWASRSPAARDFPIAWSICS